MVSLGTTSNGMFVMSTKKKMSCKILLKCDVEFLQENSDLLKNKQVSMFLIEHLIPIKSDSCEVSGQRLIQIRFFRSAQIDLDT